MLQKMLPDGGLEGHWLNFRLNTTGATFLQALQQHGWKWEDGTDVKYNNWPDCTFVEPCFEQSCYECLYIQYVNSNQLFYNFEDCKNGNKALCELHV